MGLGRKTGNCRRLMKHRKNKTQENQKTRRRIEAAYSASSSASENIDSLEVMECSSENFEQLLILESPEVLESVEMLEEPDKQKQHSTSLDCSLQRFHDDRLCSPNCAQSHHFTISDRMTSSVLHDHSYSKSSFLESTVDHKSLGNQQSEEYSSFLVAADNTIWDDNADRESPRQRQQSVEYLMLDRFGRPIDSEERHGSEQRQRHGFGHERSEEYPTYDQFGRPVHTQYDREQRLQLSEEYPVFDRFGRPVYTQYDHEQRLQQSEEYPVFDRFGRPIYTNNDREQRRQQSEEYPVFDRFGRPIYTCHEHEQLRQQSEEYSEILTSERHDFNRTAAAFQKQIWIFPDITCVCCRKRCYKKQTCTLHITDVISNILPPELKCAQSLTSCLRCANLLKRNRTPTQAYWNAMYLDNIPAAIESLSEVEKRLLSRIIPFVKIIKLSGRFGQYGFKGQAVLFAQDVGEIAEQLPLNITDVGLAFVTEQRENVENSRQYYVDINKLKEAMRILKDLNPLYHDVEVDFESVNLDISQICQVTPNEERNDAGNNVQNIQPIPSEIVEISGGRAIVRGSFHQGHSRFSDVSRGRQCTANAAVAITASKLKSPARWTRIFIDNLLIIGDRLFCESIERRIHPHQDEMNREYLNVGDLQRSFEMFEKNCHLIINDNFESQVHGHLHRTVDGEVFPVLLDGLRKFFSNETSGIITSNGYSFAIWSENDVYWMFDSHSRGPKGRQAQDGAACLIRFPRIESLALMLKSNIPAINNEEIDGLYSIVPLNVIIEGEIDEMLNTIESNLTDYNSNIIGHKNQLSQDSNSQHSIDNRQSVSNHDGSAQSDHCQTSVSGDSNLISTSILQSIDARIPALNDFIEGVEADGAIPLYQLRRKTTAPLNFRAEDRAEELCWWYLFPRGRYGLREPTRQHQITPLDYYQARIMGEDNRFQKNDYLFYALSVVEQNRAYQNVGVMLRMRQGGQQPDGLVDNVFLNMRSIRGSNAYWQSSLSDLMAMVRNLGPPQWFVTLSCNDLNWIDMRKALLIADNRPNDDPYSLSFEEVQRLIEQYPVAVSRQFMIRVHAIIQYLKNHPEVLGGKLIDFWWRIEFQNRGSPHLHMVCWIEHLPAFNTPEGIALIEKVVSCSLNTGDAELDELVARVQMHKHTETCYKNRSNRVCRFGFPKKVSEKTELLEPEEAARNNGRCFVFKRTAEEINVNTYNQKLLKIWEGNMDIQPCGNVIALAYYIAKYISKSEPTGAGSAVRQAIQRAKSYGGDVGKQLYAVSNAILNQRRVSASECAFRLCHLKLRDSTRKVVFVNTCKPEERYRVLRNDGQDVHYNIFDRYVSRPDNLEEISLAEFAVTYDHASRCNDNEDDGDADVYDIDQPLAELRFITLKNGLRMQKRSRNAVLRTRYVTLTGDREGYFYSYLVAHVPFRNEEELLAGHDTAEQAFVAKQHLLRPLQAGQDIEEFRNIELELQTILRQIAALEIPDPENRENDENVDNFMRVAFEGYRDENNAEIINNEEESEDRIMSEDEYQNNVRSMNVEQIRLFTAIRDRIHQEISTSTGTDNCNTGTLKLFITGGAGSGKTFLLKMIVQLIKRGYAPTVDPMLKARFVEVAALTGVAARLVDGRTLHSTFSLGIEKGKASVYRQLTGQRLEEGRRRWRHIRWLIIDEISMVSYEILRAIHLRLQELKNNTFLFGGINVLLFGDIMQLPPVRGHWCFEQPKSLEGEPHLWQFFGLCELTQNMRQRGDTEFIDLLNNLRVGELQMPQYEILLSRTDLPEVDEFADGEAVRIYPTTALVNQYNNRMISKLNMTQRMYTFNARDESREPGTYGQRPDPAVVSNDPNNTGGLLSSIKLAIGARVMLRSNIKVSEGLVNGSMGIVRGFEWNGLRRDQLENGELPKTVYIQFDDPSIGRSYRNNEGFVGIQPTSVTYQANKGYGNVERVMLPLILSWAVTVHKLQGVTVDRGIVYLGKKIFAKGQAYVALSRVRSLAGLIVCEIDQQKLFNKPHDEKALAELMRLRSLTPE